MIASAACRQPITPAEAPRTPVSPALGTVPSADAGMGIYSAAKLYGLDFLPICVEEYDLLIPEKVWHSGIVRQLIRTLKSDAFRARIEALGGYTLDCPGEIIDVF